MHPHKLRALATQLENASLVLEDAASGSVDLDDAVDALRTVHRDLTAVLVGLHRRCILVTDDQGRYTIKPHAQLQAWDTVITEADQVTHLENLVGWGAWQRAYRVTLGQHVLTYFVD